jgi:hypothetical protein
VADGDEPPLVLQMPRYKRGEGLSLHVLSNLDILVPEGRYFITRVGGTHRNQSIFVSLLFFFLRGLAL